MELHNGLLNCGCVNLDFCFLAIDISRGDFCVGLSNIFTTGLSANILWGSAQAPARQLCDKGTLMFTDAHNFEIPDKATTNGFAVEDLAFVDIHIYCRMILMCNSCLGRMNASVQM